MPDVTYLDKYINDGKHAVLSMHNLYESVLVGDDSDHIYRTGIDDFFLIHRRELESIIQWYNIPETMYYKPKMLSLQLYGTTELWLSLLRVNNLRNITEFHYPIIKVYSPNDLKELMKIFFKRERKM